MGSNAVTTLGDPEKDVMFPFRVSHLGNGRPSFTFYAPSNMDRERWKEAIISAKQEYSSSIYALNAEPFRMRVLAGYAFGYEQSIAPRLPVFAPVRHWIELCRRLMKVLTSTIFQGHWQSRALIVE